MTQKYIIKQINYFGFNAEKVRNYYEGKPEYIGDVAFKNTSGTFAACSVFKVEKPNREKGHKDYMLIQILHNGMGIVAGADIAQMKEHAEHSAVHCLECDTVLYSIERHHFHKCGCPNEAMVDGGKDYFKCGAVDMSRIETGTLDVLTGKFKVSKKKTSSRKTGRTSRPKNLEKARG